MQQLLSQHSRAATTEAHEPRACAPQQETPPQREAHALQLEKTCAKQQQPRKAKKLINIRNYFLKRLRKLASAVGNNDI